MPGSEHNQPDKPKRAKIVKKKPVRGSAKRVQSLGELAAHKRGAKVVRPSLFMFTLQFIYKNLYIVGITLLRRRLRYARRLRMQITRMKGSLYAFTHRLGLSVRRIYGNILKRIKAPFIRIGDTYRQQMPVVDALRREGKSTAKAYGPIVEAVARLVLKILRTLFNYAAPVAALLFLMTEVNKELTKPIGLLLEYNGEEIGYIQNEGSFESATQKVRERVGQDQARQFSIDTPLYRLQAMNPWDRLIDSDELTDKLLLTSDGDIQEAYGVWINNSFLGAVTDKDAVLEELDAIKEENASGRPNERIEFIKRVEVTPLQLFASERIVDAEQVVRDLRTNEDEQMYYTVVDGDTPSGIADKVNMPYADLKALNPTIEEDLKPGMEVLTQTARPFMSVKSIYTDVYEEDIEFEVEETENAMYPKSSRQVTQEGVEGLAVVTAEITTINGIETERNVLETRVIREAVPEKVTVGIKNPDNIISQTPAGDSGTTGGDTTPSTSQARSSGFIWPTVSGRATTYPYHSGNGIDIAPGGANHPIYASAAGTVVKVEAGWVGYGHQILIDHGNGYQTRYAHLSSFNVSYGQHVAQGDVIGYMGRTGMATGNHLHFEVIYNGRPQYPVDYVGRYG